jgi:predicted nuclease of predicted toxin-antitoxin system
MLSCHQVSPGSFLPTDTRPTHVADIGLASASDSVIWSHAATIGAVLITKDEDFVMLRALDNNGPPVVWVRIGNTTKRALLGQFAEKFAAIVASLERGDTIIEISDRSL